MTVVETLNVHQHQLINSEFWPGFLGITNDDALLDLTKWILSQKFYIKYIQPHHFCWYIFLFNHLTLQSDLELSVVANNGIIISIARLP